MEKKYARPPGVRHHALLLADFRLPDKWVDHVDEKGQKFITKKNENKVSAKKKASALHKKETKKISTKKKVNKCSLPPWGLGSGYKATTCTGMQTALTCKLSCNTGFSGTPKVSCYINNTYFDVSGCVRMHLCSGECHQMRRSERHKIAFKNKQ